MALYKEDIVNIELESGSIHRSWMNHAIGMGDVKANRFGVRIFRNGEPVNIGSGTCQGFFMRSDGTNLQIQGSTYTGVDGNMAWVQLPQDAYAFQGQFCLAIKLIGEGITGTMRIIDGMVDNTGTTGAVSPTSTVPTSQEIIAAYNNAVAVIDNSVRFDITQSLTEAQKTKARTNIEAAGTGEVSDLESAIVQISSVSEDAKVANIFEGKQSNVVGSYMTRSADGYSGVNCVGTLRYQVYEYISSSFALLSNHQYTLYIEPKHNKAEYDGVCFNLRDQTSASNVQSGGNDVVWEIGENTNALVFTPDTNYSSAYVNIYNNNSDYASGLSVDETFYIYVVDGTFTDASFFTNEKIYNKIIESSVRFDEIQSLTDTQKGTARTNIGAVSTAELNTALDNKISEQNSTIVQLSSVSEDAKAANIFEGKQSNAVGSFMTRSADGYSGVHCVGTLRYQVYEYISSTFALSSSNQYTLYIVPKHQKASYGKICFAMRDQTSSTNVKVGGQDLIWEIGTGNNVLQFTPDANYSAVYFNIYNNDENYQSGMSIDETFYIYLLNGVFGDKDVFTNEKIYKTMSEQFDHAEKNLFRMSKISPTVIENNLIKDSLIPLSNGGLTITPDKSTSSVKIVGTLAYQINRYINNANIAIETGKEYTLFIAARMEKAYNKGIKFILYDQTSGTPVTADGEDVYYSLDNNLPVVFAPDGNHAKVFINIYQETEVSGIVLDDDYYIYLVEGYYSADKFTTTESDTSKVIYEGILSKNILSGNLFDGKQYENNNTTNIRRTVDGYSSVHITGTLQFQTYEFISKLMTLESGKVYTLFIKPKKWENKYNKIFFNLKDQTTNDFVKTGGQSLFYQMNRRKAFTFVPDADYSSVFVNIYQDDPLYSSGMEIDETFYIYLVEGDYATSDLTIPDTDEELYAYDYERTQVTDALIVGLPILELTGETNLMTKDDEVTLQWAYNGSHGNCTMKWQGASSVAYSKKNYTIKFDSKIDVGWGEQKKYVLKANYIDDTSSLNLCCAKIWSEIVANRNTHPAIPVAANKGAMDGFPIIIMLNGKFHGLYTMNTPKDKWTFGMGSGETEYIVTAEQGTPATSFKALTDLEGDDFELEYAPDGVSVDTVKTSLNTMITSVLNASLRGWESAVDPYLDVNTAIDYMIFSALITNLDGVNKNYILTTYDGTKWWFNAYDLDSTFGLYWTGGSYVSAGHTPTSFAGMDITSRIFHLIYSYSKPALIARYRQLRSYLLSEGHIYSTFYNFCVKIPEPIHAEDQKKWPLKPGTNTNTLARIMENFRLRCAFIDAEIDAMET